MGPVVRLVGSGIGLASEAITAHKQKKQTRSRSPSPLPVAEGSGGHNTAPRDTSSLTADNDLVEVSDKQANELIANGQAIPVGYRDKDLPEDNPPAYGDVVQDEEDWELDEAGEDGSEGDRSGNNDGEKPDVRKILQKFLSAHPLPANRPATTERLPCPVIIPQRRPRSKARGFVKAYAPVLENCGIDQDTFMDFLETFKKASQASPIFTAILVGATVAGFVPSVTAMVTSTVLQVSATAAIVMQSRSRTNTFLDDTNEHFFRPRGLYALLVVYKPSRHRWSSEPLDISKSVSKSVTSGDASGFSASNLASKVGQNLKFASGTSHTELEMPEAAPLIYPGLDAVAVNEDTGKEQSKIKASSNFVSEYRDRRAQAAYKAENPSSSLNVPQEQKFASRYADPNHPASSGSLVSLLTGGHVDPRGTRRRKDDVRAERRGFRSPLGMIRHYQPVRRLMREGVLYLMIVNMPSDEEMAVAKAAMENPKSDENPS